MKFIYLTIGMALTQLFMGCEILDESKDLELERTPLTELDIPVDFDFSTKKDVAFAIKTVTPGGQVLGRTRVNVSSLEEDGNSNFLFSGTTDEAGVLKKNYVLPAALNSVVIETQTIGLVSQVTLPIEGSEVFCDYGNLPESVDSPASEFFGMAKSSVNYKIGTMGSHNNRGVPRYLVERDIIDAEFLNDVNASLPGGAPVPEAHPEYLASGKQINTLLGEPADVWITFVHEGAGYRNILGFYSYPIDTPPQSVDDIDSVTIAFPNVSYRGSGGGLRSGDKVYLGHFPAGTEIGWVLFANGWKRGITPGHMQVYSIPEFNPESDPVLQQHNVLLYDEARDLSILGFEDLDRSANSDDDFNDALFYVTSNPSSAILNDSVEVITYTGNDADGDGVNDPVDDYPNDPTRAYNNYHPSRDTFGSLSFEDLWPNQGDYDFNDLVVDYQFTEIMNADNQIVDLVAELVLKASGASFENGFGFEMEIGPEYFSAVTGSVISGGLHTFLGNGLEAGQDKAVVIAFDNVYSLISRPDGYYFNTQLEAPYLAPDTLQIQLSLTEPLDPGLLGAPPYNPFIIVNQTRTREVHLADHPPTTLAAGSDYFDSGDDHSSTYGYYRTSNSLPWALDIVETLAYPLEKATINNGHLYFESWAVSNGNTWSDWYKAKPGYRDAAHLYNR